MMEVMIHISSRKVLGLLLAMRAFYHIDYMTDLIKKAKKNME